MSICITLKLGETSKKETIRIENLHTGEIILVGLAKIKGKQARLRMIDNENNYSISRIPDTFIEDRKLYKPQVTPNYSVGHGGLE